MRIIVIGAGLAGLSAAWYLHRRDHEVTVVERAEGPALATSRANGGMLTPSQGDPWNRPGIAWELLRHLGDETAPVLVRPRALPGMLGWALRFLAESHAPRHYAHALANARLAARTLALLPALRAAVRPEYAASDRGTLKVFRTTAALERSAGVAARLAAAGVRHVVLDADGVTALEPALADVAGELAGGIHYPDDQAGDAHRFCVALARRLTEEGVSMRYGCRVRRLLRSGAHVRGVETDQGTLVADRYVLAAGSHAVQLARSARLPLPVRPVKGYSITVPVPASAPAPAPALPVVDDDLHAAVTPLGDRLRVSGTAELAGFDERIQPQRIDNLRRLLMALFPALAPGLPANEALAPWAGLRPVSADGVPLVGPTHLPELWLNVGHGHLGWSMSLGAGALLAELMDGDVPALDPAPYDPRRFS